MATFFFYFFSALTILGALFLVFKLDPVNGAMGMIVSLVGVAVLFLLLQAFFLAMLQIVVYAGAVMVLFLFIIMLLNAGERHRPLVHGFDLLVGLVSFVVLLVGAGWLASQYPVTVTPPPAPLMPPADNPLGYAITAKAFGYGLFTRYLLPFELTGFLLLAAMVGIIVLSKRIPPPPASGESPR
ncbi:MAG: NADH-quinone oxidoreductase subunit J [Opitutales bacterium]|jgi:NADH-quinone oxidoreductase subunit J